MVSPDAPDPAARAVATTGGLDVVDNDGAGRYEAWVDGKRAGVLEYRRRTGSLVLDHTEVSPAFEGRGVGSRLVRAALDDIRARGLELEPRCEFVTAYLERHPADRDLVRTRGTTRADGAAPEPDGSAS